MNTVLLQLNIEWGKPSENIQRAEALMHDCPDADLYVLPEMWATGFTQEPELMAEKEEESIALQWMRSMAKRRKCAICGSLAVKLKDGSFRNRMYFVMPDREVHYDKHHLFTHGKEHENYQSGNQHVVVEWKGIRFLLLVCYDLRFPVWSRYGIAGEYDAIVYVANWPQSRQPAWQVLIQARAIENQCYVIAVNRVGSDPVVDYAGGSTVIDPIGRIVATCKTHAEQSLKATLCIDEIKTSRAKFKALSDRDLTYSISQNT